MLSLRLVSRAARHALAALALLSTAGLLPLTRAAIDVSPTESTAQIINPISGFFRWRGGATSQTPYITGTPPGNYAVAGNWLVPIGTYTVPTGQNPVDHYNRFYWADLESSQGVYNFAPIDSAIAAAQNPLNGDPGSKFAFRIRAMRGREDSGTFVPAYLKTLMAKGWTKSGTDSNNAPYSTYIPDWNDPDFLARHDALIQALAARYDGDPNIAYIDIGSYGCWGEWHTSGVYPSTTGAVSATEATCQAIVNSYVNAFKKTRLIMMTDREATLTYVLQKTPAEYVENGITYKSPWIGWRRDSLANTHFDDVDNSLTVDAQALFYERWKKAPAITETYNASGVSPNLIPTQVAYWHIAGLGNGNFSWSSYDATQRQYFLDAAKLMGYRFVLSRVQIPGVLAPGSAFAVSATWKNTGVATAYERLDVVYQLRSGTTVVWESPSSLELASYARPTAQGGDVTGLLPLSESGSPTIVSDALSLPGSLPGGPYDLAIIVRTHDNSRGPIKLAITNAQNADGSYTISPVTVSATTAPTITAQPSSLTKNIGASATFSVTASGNPAPTYQWKRNGSAISGATNSSYTIAAVASTDAATYTVTVSNSAGSVTSDSAMLTVVSGVYDTFADIGGPSLAGGTSYSGTTYTLTASGSDIWGSSDQFHYSYSSVTGDAVLIARVTGIQNTNAWAKAGVMLRETTAADSRFAYVYVTPANGVSFDYRSTAATSAIHAGSSSISVTAPYWVKLMRSGNVFTGFMSSDGATWTQLGGAVTISMGSSCKAGLAATSHTNAALATATFTNVSLNTYVSSIDNFDDGNVSSPLWTTATGTGGAVTVTASNSDARADGSAYYATLTFNSTATWQYAVLQRDTATFGQSWVNNGVNALRLWVKGSTSNNVSANNKVKLNVREGTTGDRWSLDIGDAAKVGSWQQITVPIAALYYDGTQTASGTPNALDVNLVDQVRIMSNDNGSAITLKIDRIEAIKQ